MTVLAKPAIRAAREAGSILIEPFCEANLKNCSYDVSLGEWYWKETPCRSTGFRLDRPGDHGFILNPYDRESVEQMWGPEPLKAEPLNSGLPGIPAGSLVIQLHPGQNILAHTQEFIGGCDSTITTMVKARSSVGRSQVTICRCAGWGDVGYSNRFTLEISNHGNRIVLLVVGRTIGQVVFFQTTGLEPGSADSYFVGGKYQDRDLKGLSYDELLVSWKPTDMLPKMYKDYPTP